jgi:inner membrane protein
MPTPLGHALAGIAAGAASTGSRPLMGNWRDLILFSLLGQLPDLDFIPGIIMGKPDMYHHGISHSLGAALMVGLIVFLIKIKRSGGLRWGLMAFWVVLSHVVLDAINVDTSYPHGVPLLWPFSSEYYLIYPLFLDVWREPPWLETIIHNLLAMGLEFAVLGPIALGFVMWRNRRRYQRGSLA